MAEHFETRLDNLESFRRDVDKALPLMNEASVEIDNKVRRLNELFQRWMDETSKVVDELGKGIIALENKCLSYEKDWQLIQEFVVKMGDIHKKHHEVTRDVHRSNMDLQKGLQKTNCQMARLEEGFNNLVANQETLSTKQEGYAVLLETLQKRLDILSLQVEPKGVGSGKIMLKECGFDNPAIGGMPESDY